ncbi:MAG: pyridoxal-phosphate dependent enzyme [Sulfolobales archaeon]
MKISSLLEKIDRGMICLSCGYVEKRVWRDYIDKCPVCGGPLVPVLNEIPEPVDEPGIWRWSRGFLYTDVSTKITFFEGSTPLIKSSRLYRDYKIKNLYYKDESRNPNSLFIDRGSAYLSSILASRGARSIIIISRGDLAISMSSYARRARMKVFAFLPGDIIPSKLYKVKLMASRATIIEDYEAFQRIIERTSSRSSTDGKKRYVIIQMNPYLTNGFQTILFEILHDLGKPPNVIMVPFGDGALMTSLVVLVEKLKLPTKIIGVTTDDPDPVLNEIRGDNSLLRKYVEELISDTNHSIVHVSRAGVLSAIQYMSREEGLAIDAINASLVAGLFSADLRVMGTENTVLVFTGGMINDPAVIKTILRETKIDRVSLGYTKEKILEILLEEEYIPVYRIWKRLAKKYGIRISLRAIYNHIKDLEKKGFIRSEIINDESTGRPRKIYVLNNIAYEFLKR